MAQIINRHGETLCGGVYKTGGKLPLLPFPCLHRCAAMFLSAPLVVLSLLGGSVQADFACSSEVAYKWVRNQREVSPAAKDETAAASGAGNPEPSVVKLMAIERSGADENAAKEALQAEVSRQRSRISALCKKEHEAFGDCIAGKLSNKSSILNSLGFSVREEVQRGLVNECKEQSGTCLSVDVSEPKCREVVVAKPADAAGDGKKDGKKGDGKKK